MISHSCITQEIPLKQIKGDTKWFVKRRDKALKQEALKKDKELEKLEQVQKGISLVDPSNSNARLNVGGAGGTSISQIKDPQAFVASLQKGIY